MAKKHEKRNEDIKKEFEKMNALKKFKTEYICEQLAEKFYLSAATVYDIVNQIGHYKPKEENEESKTN